MAIFLSVQGMDGGIDDPARIGQFNVDAFEFKIENVLVIGGSGSGKPIFYPLAVDISQSTHLNGLIDAAVRGLHLARLQLQVTAPDGQVIYDLRLEDLIVTRITDTNGADHIEFDFTKYTLTTYDLAADGTLGPAETVGFDRVTTNSLSTPLTAPTTGTAGGLAVAKDFYLTVQGQDGGVNLTGKEGTFQVKNFNFDISNDLLNFTGGAVGKTKFAPLSIELTEDAHLNGLLESATRGVHISAVRLQGVAADGVTVYDLRLEDVVVTQVADGNGTDYVEIDFTKFTLTTLDKLAAGGYDAPETTGFNRATASILTAPLAIASAGALGGLADAAGFYLTIGGHDGGVNVTGVEGAYLAKDFLLDITQSALTFTGGSAGKATFAPLILDLDPSAPLNALLKAASQGTIIPLIRLQGLARDGVTVYDLRLDTAMITSVIDSNGAKQVAIDFTKFTLTTYDKLASGTYDIGETVGFDRATSSALTVPLGTPVPGVSGSAGNNALTGTSGRDLIDGRGGDDMITGLAGDDILFGNSGNDSLDGGAGNDTLNGGLDVDQILGGAGNDIIFYDAADNLAAVLGGTGTDALVFSSGAAPTSFNLVAHEFERAEGRFQDTGPNAWATYSNNYDSSWRLTHQTGVMDDGKTYFEDYDEFNNQTWVRITYWNDGLGRPDTETGLLDNGNSYASDHDNGNLYSWARLDYWTDALGRSDIESGFLDDGRTYSSDLDNGDAFAWSRIDNWFDAQSRHDYQNGAYDADDAARPGWTWQVDYDQANEFAWTRVERFWNASGVLQSETFF